jgi:bloom syndrome protein
MREAPAVPNKRENHLKQARDLLSRWRDDKCATVYRRRPWGPQVLLPDDVLTKFATWARLKTVDDLVSHSDWSHTHAAKHGDEILAILAELDEHEKLQRLAGNKKQADERKAATAERKRLEKEARVLESAQLKALKALQPPKKRASRASKKPTPALANISNTMPTVPLASQLPAAYTVLSGIYHASPTPPTPPPLLHIDAALPFAFVNNFDLAVTMAGPSILLPTYSQLERSFLNRGYAFRADVWL